MPDVLSHLRIRFSCEHVGAAFSLILVEKLALAALDQSSGKTEVALTRNIDERKRKLEVLVGVKPPAPVDHSEKRESVALAGGELLAAAFAFVWQTMEGDGRAKVQ